VTSSAHGPCTGGRAGRQAVLLREVLIEASSQLRNVVRRRRKAGCRITREKQVVGQHDPVTTGHWTDFMSTVGVERDEGKQLARRAVRRRASACSTTNAPPREVPAASRSSVPTMASAFSGVLVRDEELARSIDEYRMQLSLQGAAIGQAQIGAELWQVSATWSGSTAADRSAPCSWVPPTCCGPGIGERLLAQPVPCRTGYATQLPGLRRGHRNSPAVRRQQRR